MKEQIVNHYLQESKHLENDNGARTALRSWNMTYFHALLTLQRASVETV